MNHYSHTLNLFLLMFFLSTQCQWPRHTQLSKSWRETHLLWLNSVLLWGKTSFKCHRNIFSLNGTTTTTKMYLISAYQRERSSTRAAEVIVGVASVGKRCFTSEEKTKQNMESTCNLSKTICLAACKMLSICVLTWAGLPWRPWHIHAIQGHQLVDIK